MATIPLHIPDPDQDPQATLHALRDAVVELTEVENNRHMRLREDMMERFDKVDERFDSLEKSVDERFNKVDERLDEQTELLKMIAKNLMPDLK